ncbi:DEAD/DEAH box helicase family protein [Desulfosporosinus fructosivorans]
MGTDGLRIVEDVLCRPIEVRPLLRDILEADDKLRIRLTNEQSSVLRTLARHKRAAIVGAAGTGKTILAAEKVRTLASIGAKVLFLCYNKALGEQIYYQLLRDQKEFLSFFHLLGYQADKINIEKLIREKFYPQICENSDLAKIIVDYPIELSYCLALIVRRVISGV